VSGPGAESVVLVGAEYLRTVGVTYIFLGTFYIIQGGFRGSGRTRLAMVFAFIGFIVLRSALAYVFAVPLELGATGIWYGEAASNVLMAVLAVLYFRRGTWTNRLGGDEQVAVDQSPPDDRLTGTDQPADTD
jgi:Na+-driven multidrug efflux pump